MSINLTAVAKPLVGIGLTLANAQMVITAAVTLIETVEGIYDGLKGSEKLAAVKAGLATLVDELGLADDFDRLWKTLGPVVSLIVSVYKLKGLFAPKPAQIPAPGVSGGSAVRPVV